MKNIILIDDHVIIRNGLKELIEKLGAYKVTAQFDNGRQLLNAYFWTPKPDLLIMDLSMPELDGEETMAQLKEREIDVPVLILTLNQTDNKVIRVFRLGARGYLEKNCTAAVMREAISEILERGFYHNEFLAFSLRNTEVEKPKAEADKILEQLTNGEREFLKLVCHEKEFTYDQIAGEMNVQHRTVDGYREAIFEKFGIKSKTGLVLFVLKHKLFDRL
jgi:two-component system, NarL family, invasion response regulator UvrY